tara:strand:- start:365 stop:709 length:345 start_codon:yes stop_codon:yes gene_type:complete
MSTLFDNSPGANFDFTTAIFTALGAYGVNMIIPDKISEMWTGDTMSKKMVRYGLLFVLVMQGGGNMNVQNSLVITLMIAAFNEFMLKRQADAAAANAAATATQFVRRARRRRRR